MKPGVSFVRTAALLVPLLLVLQNPAVAQTYFPTREFLDWGHQPFDSGIIPDAQGVATVLIDGAYRYNPVTISDYGLQNYSYWWLFGSQTYLDRAVIQANWLVSHQDSLTGMWYYDFDFSVGAMDVTLKAPWGSAMAQGMALSLLSRVWWVTKNNSYLVTAAAALKSLSIPVSQGGLATDFFGKGQYYEEYPTTPPSFTLNGFLFTLIGLYDFNEITGSLNAWNLYLAGFKTLVAALPYYDDVTVSAYHLGHLTNPPRKVHASAYYHGLHVKELQALNSVTPDPVVSFYYNLWAQYTPGPDQ